MPSIMAALARPANLLAVRGCSAPFTNIKTVKEEVWDGKKRKKEKSCIVLCVAQHNTTEQAARAARIKVNRQVCTSRCHSGQALAAHSGEDWKTKGGRLVG